MSSRLYIYIYIYKKKATFLYKQSLCKQCNLQSKLKMWQVIASHGLDTISSHGWEYVVYNNNRVKFSNPSLMCKSLKTSRIFKWNNIWHYLSTFKIKCSEERWKELLHQTMRHLCLQYPQYDPGFSMLQSNGKPNELRLLKSVFGGNWNACSQYIFFFLQINHSQLLLPSHLQCNFVVAQTPSLLVVKCILQDKSERCK